MKKILSFILTAVMLLSMIPALAVSMGAEGTGEESAAQTPLTVEFVSSSTNYHGETLINFSTVFDPTSSARIAVECDNEVEIIGRLSEPAQITSFVVRSHHYRNRVTGMVISFSADGESWTKGYTLTESRGAKDGVSDVVVPIVDDTTKYSHVRITKKVTGGDGAGANKLWFDIHHVAFYSDPAAAQSSVGVKSTKILTAKTTQNLDKLFDKTNTTLCTVSGSTKEALIECRLAIPTVISNIYISYNQAYMNNTVIEASEDGEKWVAIANTGGIYKNAGNSCSTTVAHLSVADTTVYRYVRIVRGHVYLGGWNAYSITFSGTEVPIFASGYQLAEDGENTYAIRLINQVVELDENAKTEYGVTIRCVAEDGRKWKLTSVTDKLVSSITENTDEGENILTAESFEDCKGFYTAVVENIPKNIGLFSVYVTPYVRIDGKKTVGLTKALIMENDKILSASTFYLEEQTSNIKISGRSYDVEDGIACDFAASGIEFNAVVAGDIKITAWCDALTYYTVYIDGYRQDRIEMKAGTGEYLIAEKLDAGMHNIRLVKQTHIGLSASTLLTMSMKGKFADKPMNRELLIEFVGDSITCGYGVVNYPAAGVSKYNTAEYADATQAYAYKTAELLDADSSLISVSGWTLISGETSVPEQAYDHTSFRRSTEDTYTPTRAADIVVINLGTNDMGSTEYSEKFVKEAKEFVTTVRAKNPNAVVVFAYGMMMSGETLNSFETDIQTIVRDLGATDAGVFAVKLPTDQAAGNGHPSIEGHTQAAEILAEFIKDNCL